jgi:hypothetical protein
MPCHAALRRGLEKSLSEQHGRGMARARHGMCESNTAALCKPNGKDAIQPLSGTAWQGKGMVVTWERHGMCKLGLREAAGFSKSLVTPIKLQKVTPKNHKPNVNVHKNLLEQRLWLFEKMLRKCLDLRQKYKD